MRRSRKCSRTRRRRCVSPALLPSGFVRAYALASWGQRRKAQGEQALLFPFSSSVCRQHAVALLSRMTFPSGNALTLVLPGHPAHSCRLSWHSHGTCGKFVLLSLTFQAGVGVSQISPCLVWGLLATVEGCSHDLLCWFPQRIRCWQPW